MRRFFVVLIALIISASLFCGALWCAVRSGPVVHGSISNDSYPTVDRFLASEDAKAVAQTDDSAVFKGVVIATIYMTTTPFEKFSINKWLATVYVGSNKTEMVYITSSSQANRVNKRIRTGDYIMICGARNYDDEYSEDAVKLLAASVVKIPDEE